MHAVSRNVPDRKSQVSVRRRPAGELYEITEALREAANWVNRGIINPLCDSDVSTVRGLSEGRHPSAPEVPRVWGQTLLALL